MQLSNIPTKIPVPFASDADGSHKRTIPASTPVEPGGATYQYGWQNINFLPTESGGVPPFGQDFNGVLEQITQWLRWSQAGGPTTYDSTFQTGIGGYPQGSVVQSAATSGLYWVSTAENNVTNPDTGGAGWSVPFFPDPGVAGVLAGLIVRSTTSAGAGIKFEGNGSTAQNKLLRVNSGKLQVVNNAYTAVVFDLDDAGDLRSVRNIFANGGVQGTFMTATNGNVTALNGSLIATFDGTLGRNLFAGGNSQVAGVSYFGNSGTFYVNPLHAGSQQLLNFAPSQYLLFNPAFGFTLNTTGATSIIAPSGVNVSANLSAGGTVSAAAVSAAGAVNGQSVNSFNGNITANNARVRASFGGYLSGDGNACLILGDFGNYRSGNEGYTYMRLPDGTAFQSWRGVTAHGAGEFVTFPIAFSQACTQVLAHEGDPGGWAGGTQPSVFGTDLLQANGFRLWETSFVGGAWSNRGGITYRWFAWGY